MEATERPDIPTSEPPAAPAAKPNRRAKVSAKAERQRRLTTAALNQALAAKRCARCATLGAWGVYDTERTAGRTRYIRCKACGGCDQITLILQETDDHDDAK